MTRPYSNDLRERVVGAVEFGASCRAVAARFGVAISTVVKWSQRKCATGSVAPGKIGGHRRAVLAPYRAYIVERIDREPHLRLHRLKDELAARGRVSHNTVWTLLRREGLWVPVFDQIAQPLCRLRSTNLRESGTLAQIADLLLPRLISGEIRLTDSENPSRR